MSFYEQLQANTQHERKALLSSQVIADCLNNRVGHETYVAFLSQAYHHVRHTVPLLMACGSRLPERLSWLQKYVAEYIEDELGHEQWIFNDINATGASAPTLLAEKPSIATEVMVSYAYDTIARGNPVGFFGMVYVLEGTSVAIASQAADIIKTRLNLPVAAFSYLRSHGSLDVSHLDTYREIVNRLADERDQAAVMHAARVFFKLYADVFGALPRAPAVVAPTHVWPAAQREIA